MVSAGNIIRGEAVGVAFSADILRRGIAVSIFSANVIGREAMSVVSVDNIIR